MLALPPGDIALLEADNPFREAGGTWVRLGVPMDGACAYHSLAAGLNWQKYLCSDDPTRVIAAQTLRDAVGAALHGTLTAAHVSAAERQIPLDYRLHSRFITRLMLSKKCPDGLVPGVSPNMWPITPRARSVLRSWCLMDPTAAARTQLTPAEVVASVEHDSAWTTPLHAALLADHVGMHIRAWNPDTREFMYELGDKSRPQLRLVFVEGGHVEPIGCAPPGTDLPSGSCFDDTWRFTHPPSS